MIWSKKPSHATVPLRRPVFTMQLDTLEIVYQLFSSLHYFLLATFCPLNIRVLLRRRRNILYLEGVKIIFAVSPNWRRSTGNSFKEIHKLLSPLLRTALLVSKYRQDTTCLSPTLCLSSRCVEDTVLIVFAIEFMIYIYRKLTIHKPLGLCAR